MGDDRACKRAGAHRVTACGWPSLPDCYDYSATANDHLSGWGRPNRAAGALGDDGFQSHDLFLAAIPGLGCGQCSDQVSRLALLYKMGGDVLIFFFRCRLVWRADLATAAEESTFGL